MSITRDAQAAKRFFATALGASHTVALCATTVDKNAAYPKAVKDLKRAGDLATSCEFRRTAPGRERTVSAAWETELLRVIEFDPHEVSVETANWTTERLAEYLGQQTGIQVTEETVRVYLHAHDYVCKRSTWTLRCRAEEKPDDVGNACG